MQTETATTNKNNNAHSGIAGSYRTLAFFSHPELLFLHFASSMLSVAGFLLFYCLFFHFICFQYVYHLQTNSYLYANDCVLTEHNHATTPTNHRHTEIVKNNNLTKCYAAFLLKKNMKFQHQH